MDRRFFHRLGASQLARTICSETGGQALKSVYGQKLGTDTEAFRHAKLILAWAANIHGNNIHLWPFIEEARRKGAQLVVIDPYATRTARAADWHIPIRPGTDSALALGMMHILIRDRLYDEDYVARWTFGVRATAGARGRLILRNESQQSPASRSRTWSGSPSFMGRRRPR